MNINLDDNVTYDNSPRDAHDRDKADRMMNDYEYNEYGSEKPIITNTIQKDDDMKNFSLKDEEYKDVPQVSLKLFNSVNSGI